MKVSNYLTSDRISFELKSSSKEGAIRELASMFLKDNNIIKEGKFNDFVEDLMEREKISSTGMQDGIAIPHAKSSSVEKISAALCISRKGIDFSSLDDIKSRIFFMIAAPEFTKNEHLHLLSTISKLSFEEELLEEILTTNSKERVLEILDSL